MAAGGTRPHSTDAIRSEGLTLDQVEVRESQSWRGGSGSVEWHGPVG